MKTITNIIYPAFALFAFACFALAPQARAVCQNGCDTGNGNTFLGENALINNTTGARNTAIGDGALVTNTTGVDNTATGSNSLFSNTGSFNTANGARALLNNTTGENNTATGDQALASNTTGSHNAAYGVNALFNNTDGFFNVGIGNYALFSNTTGGANTATGHRALVLNTTGLSNTATGTGALQNNVTANENTATGYLALGSRNGDYNTATGAYALLFSTGNSNIAVGWNAGANLTTGSNNIDIGNNGVAAESNTIRIGTSGTQTRTFIAGVNGAAVMGAAVKVNAAGQLGTAPSSARFKDEIKPMDKASEAIHALKPVTFRYKKEIDSERIPQFGLVAEDVEKVNRDLVVRDKEGKPYSVRYDQVNAMLLNEFLKEHKKVEEQGAIIARQQKQIEALTAGLQKVSAQLEVSKPAPRTVLNNQ